MATEDTPDKVAADAVIKANETRDPADIAEASKDVLEALWVRFAGQWGWKPLLTAVIATLMAIGTIISTRPHPDDVKAIVKDAVKEAKEDPVPTPPQADLAKMLAEGFAGQSKLMTDLTIQVKRLADRPDPLPLPVPVDPDNKPTPKPKVLSIPDSASVTVGGGLTKIKALSPSPVEWFWKPVDGFNVERYGDVLYIEATKEGSMWVIAYSVNNSKVSDFAACLVTTLKAPQPPPVPVPTPIPNPPVPTPTPVSLNELGKLILIQASKPGRKDEAAKLATVYEALVADIRAGRVATVNQAVKQLFDGNTQALGNNSRYWAGFFAWADNELTRRAELGKLTTIDQNRDAFEQIGAALREASK